MIPVPGSIIVRRLLCHHIGGMEHHNISVTCRKEHIPVAKKNCTKNKQNTTEKRVIQGAVNAPTHTPTRNKKRLSPSSKPASYLCFSRTSARPPAATDRTRKIMRKTSRSQDHQHHSIQGGGFAGKSGQRHKKKAKISPRTPLPKASTGHCTI